VRWFLPRFPHAARAALLLLSALLIAAIFNAANPLGIRWTPTSDGRVGIPRVYESRLPQITVEQALALFESGETLFVDSRDRKDYEKDHIPGAINLPQRIWVEVWPEMQSQVPRDRTLVLYCYGGHCGLSTRQAKRLLAEGYENFLILDRGWDGWTEAGNPTHRQPDGER
jgi:rhodanese-related sulfurtransferase